MNKKEFEEQTYEDEQGYRRWKDSRVLVHRTFAKKEIYLKDRKKYPLSFFEYQVHHKDGDKKNNRVENLELIPIRDHELKHNIHRYEYSIITELFIFVIMFLALFGYYIIKAGRLELQDVIFNLVVFGVGFVLLYLVGRKKKGGRYV
jgi:hypothetical protein